LFDASRRLDPNLTDRCLAGEIQDSIPAVRRAVAPVPSRVPPRTAAAGLVVAGGLVRWPGSARADETPKTGGRLTVAADTEPRT